MKTTDFDILVVGELNADLILSGDVAPEFGQVEKLVDDASLVLGSSSAIFACGAARLGLRVVFVGKVGDDVLGQFALGELRKRGVNTHGVVVDRAIKTGLSIILSRSNDRAILTYSGSIGALRFDEVDANLLTRARHLHLGSYFLLDALKPDVPRLFDAAHAAGLTVSMDTNYDPAEHWDGGVRDALARADVALPNEAELLALTHQPTLNTGLAALAALTPTVAVKLGRAGGVAVQGKTQAKAESLAVDVVDTVGAGDSFDAGFVYGYLAGWELARALRLGCVCGSLSTQAAGGTAAQPALAEAMALL